MSGYDVIVVAGQSNSVCSGEGPFTDPLYQPAINSRIFQVGRWRSDNLLVVPATGNVVDGVTFPCLQDWNYSPQRAGTGFATAFAEMYVANVLAPDRQVLIVPGGCGGSSILSWEGSYVDNTIACMTASLHGDLLARVNVALDQPGENKIAALLWHQGETDVSFSINPKWRHLAMTPAVYQTKLGNYFARLRADLPNGQSFPIITGRFADAWITPSTPYNHSVKIEIEAAIDAVCAQDGRCAVVDTKGLPDNHTSGVNADPAQVVHFNSQAKIIIGYQMFAKWRSLSCPAQLIGIPMT